MAERRRVTRGKGGCADLAQPGRYFTHGKPAAPYQDADRKSHVGSAAQDAIDCTPAGVGELALTRPGSRISGRRIGCLRSWGATLGARMRYIMPLSLAEGHLLACRNGGEWSIQWTVISLLPDLSISGTVKHVLYARYVTANQAMGTLSFIDVFDGMNVVTFPANVQLFVVAILLAARGGFDFSVVASPADGKAVFESESIYIPLPQAPRTNVAVPLPVIRVTKPTTLIVTLLADKVPFYQENFEIMLAPLPVRQSPTGLSATIRP